MPMYRQERLPEAARQILFLYLPAPPQLATLRSFRPSVGNIGIGTTTPAAKLDVAGTGDVRDTLTLFPKLTHPSLSIHGTAFEVSNTGKVTFVAGQTFPGTGTVTSVASGAGLTGGPITHSGTLSIATGGVTNAMLAHSSLTVSANSPLNGGGAVSLGGSTSLGLRSCGANQILEFVSGAWACVNPATGTVTSVATGLGLTGGTITTSGTISINTSVVPQLGASSNTFTGNLTVNGNINLGGTVTGAAGDFSGSSDPIVAEGGFDAGFFSGNTNGIFSDARTDGGFDYALLGFEFGIDAGNSWRLGFSASPGGFGVYGEQVSGSVQLHLSVRRGIRSLG